MTAPLPIFQLKEAFESAVSAGPVVVTAHTGSGKSTELPRWLCRAGKTLVIEPRRVACRALAAWVAKLEGDEVGRKVGYAVRNEARASSQTEIFFVTPGVALQLFASNRITEYGAIMIDEFHERTLEIDLLAALVQSRFDGLKVITSATIDVERTIAAFNAVHLHAEGTLFPVKIEHQFFDDDLPSPKNLASRVQKAVMAAARRPGDILVFLPSKGAIAECAALLRHKDLDVLEMHASMPISRQAAIFAPTNRTKVVLATNVAETSLTVPGITQVIDSGLVKRTRYIGNRGFLTQVPIAADSAAQRAGRAGRTAKGYCIRLWSNRAVLSNQTPPEIHRESLTPLVLAALCCGSSVETLPFVDAPKSYAIEEAKATLTRLGAIENDQLTDRGRHLFGLPLPVHLAALLVEADKRGVIDEAIDLVSVLETGRDLFDSTRRPDDPAADLRGSGCDITAIITALRTPELDGTGVNIQVLKEARRLARPLRRAFSVDDKIPANPPDISTLKQAALAADPGMAYVVRRKKKGRYVFTNGGKEVTLSERSAVDEEKVEGVLMLSSIALGLGLREKDAQIIITCASPISRSQMAAAAVGNTILTSPRIEKGQVIAVAKQVLAGVTLAEREIIPTGAEAASAMAELFVEGHLFPESLVQSRERFERTKLADALGQLTTTHLEAAGLDWPISNLYDWANQHLLTMGIDHGRDMALLSADDLLFPSLPDHLNRHLNEKYPLHLNLADVVYQITYDLKSKTVNLIKVSGTRKNPPGPDLLPAFSGFTVKVKHHSRAWVVKRR